MRTVSGRFPSFQHNSCCTIKLAGSQQPEKAVTVELIIKRITTAPMSLERVPDLIEGSTHHRRLLRSESQKSSCKSWIATSHEGASAVASITSMTRKETIRHSKTADMPATLPGVNVLLHVLASASGWLRIHGRNEQQWVFKPDEDHHRQGRYMDTGNSHFTQKPFHLRYDLPGHIKPNSLTQISTRSAPEPTLTTQPTPPVSRAPIMSERGVTRVIYGKRRA